jgi:hypothetical protein
MPIPTAEALQQEAERRHFRAPHLLTTFLGGGVEFSALPTTDTDLNRSLSRATIAGAAVVDTPSERSRNRILEWIRRPWLYQPFLPSGRPDEEVFLVRTMGQPAIPFATVPVW